jgi:EAL domain-containing protein (putative c-di-GMP-specific phosphodiesterase class I)
VKSGPRSDKLLVSDARTGEFAQLLERRNLRPAYQPIIDLSTRQIVAVEALARWPDLGVNPERAFALAASLGRLDELDMACRNAAIDDALNHGLPAHFQLFVNIEPSVLAFDTAEKLLERARGRLNIVAEITERALTTRPAELLRAVRELRAGGCVIALDDVGAVPESLALLPFVAPAVIKLDISLVQGWPDVAQAGILTAVAAYAERTGAQVLAEGIESETHLRQALALGAKFGQGWYFARPGPLSDYPTPSRNLFQRTRDAPSVSTPFAGIDETKSRIGEKGLLLGISHQLESQGLNLPNPPVVISAFQGAKNFTPDTARRYSELATRCPLVAALGVGLEHDPASGVRGIAISPTDPLRGEWAVAVVGTHYLGALIARDLGDDVAESHRRFSFVVTHDHETVLAAARSLLERVSSSS